MSYLIQGGITIKNKYIYSRGKEGKISLTLSIFCLDIGGNHTIYDNYIDIIDQVIPQSAVFVTAVIFENNVKIKGESVDKLIDELNENSDSLINGIISKILYFAKNNPEVANKSWPTLLKSQTFFNHICAYLRGLEERSAEPGH